RAAFATGVPPDIYAFHRYTRNSTLLSGTPVRQFPMPFRGGASGFHIRLSGPPTRALRPVIPNNARTLRITAAAGTELAGASFRGTVRVATYSFATGFSPPTGLYDPKAFITHAASLRQAFAHCAIFPTAASRRSLGRVSVPVWPVALSGRLPVVALVGHYPTNKLIGRGLIPSRKTFHRKRCLSRSYPV